RAARAPRGPARQPGVRALVERHPRPRARRALGALPGARGGGFLPGPPASLPEAPVSYPPREFWEERLSSQFDVCGTGAPDRSDASTRSCYALRRLTLTRALAEV